MFPQTLYTRGTQSVTSPTGIVLFISKDFKASVYVTLDEDVCQIFDMYCKCNLSPIQKEKTGRRKEPQENAALSTEMANYSD